MLLSRAAVKRQCTRKGKDAPPAENTLVSGGGVSVTIDALGRAIDSGFQTATFYSADGTLRVAYKGQLARRALLGLPGGGFAIYDEGNGGLNEYDHPDHLGSVRLATTPSRTFFYSKAIAPFGEPYAASATNGTLFTGWGNFFNLDTYEFPAREYSDQGRWVSPDPAGLAAAAPSIPQTWNRCAYVQNNPLALTDPLGLCNPGANGIWTPAGYVIAGTMNDSDPEPCTTFQPWLTDPNFQCYYFDSCGSGSSSGGGGGGGNSQPTVPSGGSGLLKVIKGAYCSAVPSGRSTTVTVAAGGIGSVSGSLDIVVNYNSGQTSLFATGGGGLGWNGGGSLTATTGLVYGLDSTNNGFSGVFKGGNFYAPTPVPGVSAGGSITHGGSVTVVSAGVSGALAGRYGGGLSATNTTNPWNIGKFTGYAPPDYLGYLLRRPCT